MNISSLVIAYPAGKCPCKLKDSTFDSVVEWAEEVLLEGRNRNLVYLPSALLFFAQQFYSIFTEEYKEIKNHLVARYGNVSFYDDEIKIQSKIQHQSYLKTTTFEFKNDTKIQETKKEKTKEKTQVNVATETEVKEKKKIKLKRKSK